MKEQKRKAVFFDCWDTVISFREKVRTWNTEPLKKHCRNRDRVDFSEVEAFSDSFLGKYLSAPGLYEITAEQFLGLLVERFHLELDCPVPECVREILCYLLPEPMPGIEKFLAALDDDEVPYAILSNTIYGEKETFDIVQKLLPKANFRFLLGSSTFGIKKPYELFFETGMARLDAKPEEAIYIGDSFYADVWGANRAGMNNAIWLNSRKKDKERFRPYIDDFDTLTYLECQDYEEVLLHYRKGDLFR